MRYQLLNEDLVSDLANLDRTRQAQWLFLDPSEEFRGRWAVDSLWPEWFFDFEDIVGHYRAISPAKLDEFLDRAEAIDYRVVFNEPPEEILDAYARLSEPPPFSIHSNLPDTVQGLLPWQVAGFNKLIRDESLNAGLVIWSTGCGKTAFIASSLLYHREYGHPYDLALVVVKLNNKTDMNRKLKKMADLESVIIDGSPTRREAIYSDIDEKLANEKVTAITNYEKFREDETYFKALLKNRQVLIFWDEIPTRLSNRNTKLYKAVKRILWKRFESKEEGLAGAESRASWMRQVGLTATPVEKSPEGVFNYLRLMNPPLLGRVEEFYGEFVATKNYFSRLPERWHNLDKLEAKIEHLTHRVSREDDPQVAKLFPKVMEDTIVIDWAPQDRKIYDILTGRSKEIIEADFSEANVLALIQVLQMVCDAPSMVVESAKNREAFEALLNDFDPQAEGFPSWDGPKGSEVAAVLLTALRTTPTDATHTKMLTWKEILTEKHPDEKVLTFMTWSSYGMKPLTAKLDEWGISYVTYEGTQKQADEAKDQFREDPDIRVFLSSDRGADSIDLPEAAVGVNYNLPWTWVRKRQRMRNVRVDSKLANNYWYDLVMADSVEERKQEIIAMKYGYHAALFDGKMAEESISTKLSREDLLHILLGN